MAMQYDVLSYHNTVSGVAVPYRTRLKGIVISPSASSTLHVGVFNNTYSMYFKMLKKKNIKNLKINPLLQFYKTELFLSKNKSLKILKIKKILRKSAFLVKYHKQKTYI